MTLFTKITGLGYKQSYPLLPLYPPSVSESHLLLVRITLGWFHHPQQTPVCDFYTPAQSQNYQPLQVGGDRTHRQISHIDARG